MYSKLKFKVWLHSEPNTFDLFLVYCFCLLGEPNEYPVKITFPFFSLLQSSTVQSCGVVLLITGFYLFLDGERVLLSRLLVAANDKSPIAALEQPLFYYISLGLIASGLVIITIALMGCWAGCMDTYCILILV